MSYNIFVQLYQMRAGDTSGFKLRLALCYIVPGVITLLTLIVELAAPQCASIRPKFGTSRCHFYGGVDKFVWLYLPILILLLINSGMFIYVVTNICKNDSGSDSKSGNRSEKRDKMLIYIRLFLGMGITWYFEVINFALSSLEPDPRWLMLTDTLNMCQGVWVFIIFVCKKNVLKVVTRKSNSLYNTIAKQMSIPLRPAKSVKESETGDTTLSISNDPKADPLIT